MLKISYSVRFHFRSQHFNSSTVKRNRATFGEKYENYKAKFNLYCIDRHHPFNLTIKTTSGLVCIHDEDLLEGWDLRSYDYYVPIIFLWLLFRSVFDQWRREAFQQAASAVFTEHGGLKHCKNIDIQSYTSSSSVWAVKIKSAEIWRSKRILSGRFVQLLWSVRGNRENSGFLFLWDG